MWAGEEGLLSAWKPRRRKKKTCRRWKQWKFCKKKRRSKRVTNAPTAPACLPLIPLRPSSHFLHCPYYPLILKEEVWGSNVPLVSWYLYLCSSSAFPACFIRDIFTQAQVWKLRPRREDEKLCDYSIQRLEVGSGRDVLMPMKSPVDC